MMLHPDIYTYLCIQDVPDPAKPEDWVYFIFIAWLGEKDPDLAPEEVMRLAKSKAEKIQEPFRSAILWIPEDVRLPYADVSFWVARRWDSRGGRCTLAGDAAHPVSFFDRCYYYHCCCCFDEKWGFLERKKINYVVD